MRGSPNGPMRVLLMIAPLVLVVLFAVVGIPQFAPVVASPLADVELGEVEPGAEGSDAPLLGEPAGPDGALDAQPAVSSADDIFAPHTDTRTAASGSRDSSTSIPAAFPGAQRSFDESQGDAAPFVPQPRNLPPERDAWSPPAGALDGWEIADKLEPAESWPSEAGDDFETDVDSPDQPDAFEQLPADSDEDAPAYLPDRRRETEFNSDDAAPADLRMVPLIPDDEDTEAPPAESPFGEEANPAETLPADEFRADRRDSRGTLRPNMEQPAAGYQSIGDQERAPAALTWESANRRLESLGIQKFRLESVGEGRFLFTCSFHPAGNPRLIQRFEAESDDALEAIQQVLDQIDVWRSR